MKRIKNIITLKRLLSILIGGTNCTMKHEEFVRLLLSDNGGLLSEADIKLITDSSKFSNFMNGNLRDKSSDRSGDWTYEIVTPTKMLERIFKESPDEALRVIAESYREYILPIVINDANKDQYYNYTFAQLSDLIREENTYYSKLYSELCEYIDKKENIDIVLAMLNISG